MKKKTIPERLVEFNEFCKQLHTGDLIYNINSSNAWGEYLMVATKANIIIGKEKSYYIMFFGLRKDGEAFSFNDKKIDFTLNLDGEIPFLKVVGKCEFELKPAIIRAFSRKELIAIYKGMDLRKYTKTANVRKARYKKYADGTTVIKKINKQ